MNLYQNNYDSHAISMKNSIRIEGNGHKITYKRFKSLFVITCPYGLKTRIFTEHRVDCRDYIHISISRREISMQKVK